jgi:hypothetical protein
MGRTRGGRGESEPRPSSWFAVSAPSFYGNGVVLVAGFCPRLCRYLLRWRWVQRVSARLKTEERKRTTIFIVVRFCDAPYRPPIPWVPPRVPPSAIPPSRELEPPTSLGKGEGRVGFDSVRPGLLGVLEIGPTSLKRGEGPLSGSSRVVESEWVVREGGGGGGMSGERTNINRDGVDVRLKLRLPT